MYLFVLILCVARLTAVSSVKHWNDLRIRFGKNESDGFFPVGRTVSKILKQGNWSCSLPLSCVTETDSGTFYGYQVINNETSVALLYDVKGVIAGIQTLFPHKEILQPENEFRFDSVPMFQNFTVKGEKYFILTVYFVPPDTICESGRAELLMEKKGTGQGLWIQNGSDALSASIEIPSERYVADSDGWSMQNCFPRMGWHGFYQVEKMQAKDCLENLPIFLLYNNPDDIDIIGFGFRAFGRPTANTFEQSKNSTIKTIFKDPLPECLLQKNDIAGTTTLHVYFTEKPWLIKCS